MNKQQIVIVGAGFAGVSAALGAAAEAHRLGARDRVRIELTAPGEHLVIRPRLYERELGGVRVPLEEILTPLGVEHVRETVSDLRALRYDQLVLCAGSRRAEPLRGAIDHGVDTYEEALALREALAALAPARARVAVVGAGFTGIELAAELASEADVQLIAAGPLVAPDFGLRARERIVEALRGLNVTTHTGCPVERSDAYGVTLADGRRIGADIVVWATGPRASLLHEQLGVALDELGRVPVDEHLAAAVADVWVAGDGARARVDREHDAVMSCQQAMPQGRRAGANAVRAALGRRARVYRQPLYSTCLDLGAAGALVATGFDRDHVVSFGPEAKRVKRFINRSLIYPPIGAGAGPLLKLGQSGTAGPTLAAIQRRALSSATIRRLITQSAPDRAALLAA